MKAVLISLLAFFWATGAYTTELKYKGELTSFRKFVSHYQLDWPEPEKIDYFERADEGGTIRYAHWKPSNGLTRGVVVHFNGRTEFIERNIYIYKELLERGFEVWSLDWRGQGFSSRLLKNKQKHHISSFDQYLADANEFVDKLVDLDRYNGPKVLLAHSMGGQIALRYLLQEKPEGAEYKFDFAVLSSPLLKVPKDSSPVRFGNWLKRSFWGKACVFKEKPNWVSDFASRKACCMLKENSFCEKELVDPLKSKQYTNDIEKLAGINCLVESSIDAKGEESPDLRVACPTSHWLKAAIDSTDIVKSRASKLRLPTLIVRAKPDAAVDVDAQDDFCSQSEECQLETIPQFDYFDSGHEILIERKEVVDFFLHEFDKFEKLTMNK